MEEYDCIFSPAELQQLKKQPPRLPPSWGPKQSVPEAVDSDVERAHIDAMLKDHIAVLTEERIVRKGNLSVGVWDTDKAVAEITIDKGTHWNHFGRTVKGKMLVNAEEALFLVEQGSLELYYGGLPLSVQQAYSMLLPHAFPLDHYLVYAYLLRLGFIVIQHQSRSNFGEAIGTGTKEDTIDNKLPEDTLLHSDTSESLLNSPVSSLWKDQAGCQPLVKPKDAKSTAAVLSKLQVIKTHRMKYSTTPERSSHFIAFDVYQPGVHYKKSSPGSPTICITVCRFSDPLPSLGVISRLTQEVSPTPLKFAVVSNGNIALYSFLDADVPTFIT